MKEEKKNLCCSPLFPTTKFGNSSFFWQEKNIHGNAAQVKKGGITELRCTKIIDRVFFVTKAFNAKHIIYKYIYREIYINF